jgi:maltose/maltodextrin transport system permease protein
MRPAAAPALALRQPLKTPSPWPGRVLAALLTLGGLYLAMRVQLAGEALLATVLLVLTALLLWTYTSARTAALRYLFPGVAAALLFVIFPMLYTVGMGFTNYSSSNLLDEQRARAYLLQEAVQGPGSARPYTLHRSPEGLQLHLPATGTLPGLSSPALALDPGAPSPQQASLQAAALPASPALTLRELVPLLPALRTLALRTPTGEVLTLASLRDFAQLRPLYQAAEGGAVRDTLSGTLYAPDAATGFFTSAEGARLSPGFRVGVGLAHYAQLFSDDKFREPFAGIFLWTVSFSALTVLLAGGLGLLLAVLLNWDALPFKGAYRLVLFLPYAVPGFISILVFKGLFNQNLGEINLILDALFGIRPAWFSEPLLARAMLLFVNVWLGFPYMMIICSGLIKSIPADLYEASAVAGAGAWTNFRTITAPLILKPLTPLLISAFAFNFNNFVLISLLTGGRPDTLDSTLPAGTTDILVSYTWRIAFQDSGQQFGLASAISTVIFLIVAAITLVQMRFTRINEEPRR